MDNTRHEEFELYKDIEKRTGGEIYIGVIGPVRTGKSTFIKRMMDILVLPFMENGPEKERIVDTLPQSGSGRTITTTEPKFLPKEAFEVSLSPEVQLKVRLIDCVGYMVKGAVGHMEEDAPRMVKTPWMEEKIPFVEAAEIGTQKVMQEHSTVGLLVTCDGSFSDISREEYIEAEERTVVEMKKSGKPFVIILNSNHPYAESTVQMAKELEELYEVPVMPCHCEQLKKVDFERILAKLLQEFPITDIEFYMPKWVEMLPRDSEIKKEIVSIAKGFMDKIYRMQDVTPENLKINATYISGMKLEERNLSNGKVKIRMEIEETYYYEMLSRMMEEEISGECELLKKISELSKIKKEYVKVKGALDAVWQKGYGVVTPVKEEIVLEEPAVVKQGNRYGVKIKASAPSVHMIRADIETEIAPLVGTQMQAMDLIRYIESTKSEGKIWETNIFGKTVQELVEEGIRTKLYQIGEESQMKLQDTMGKIVNDSNGGMVCIII
jgi:stage IV sporulation protein A